MKQKIIVITILLLPTFVFSQQGKDSIRAYYYDQVVLDSISYKTTPDSSVRLQMARHYNSLAYSNLPLLFLLTNQYKKAKSLYIKYKDQPFDKSHRTYKDEFLEDFRELEKEGIINKNIKKITRLLNGK